MRSAQWFARDDLAGFLHRSSIAATGINRHTLDGRPVIGICNSWSDLVSCNFHLRGLADAVKRGVAQAGGIAVEFPTMSLGESLMKPTAMLYRNLVAMEVEESIRAYPIDAVVLLGGCDKTVPAQLMGAAGADVPAIALTGGPANPAIFRGRELGVGTDLWGYVNELRAGRMSQSDFDELEAASMPSVGHCPELGTASTMAALTEALGMALPGSATIPATNSRRYAFGEATGERAVALARSGPRPSQILTAAAFDNAITTLMALGGSTNAVVHLLAIARRIGVPLSLDRFDEISARTPLIANLRPSGEELFARLNAVGGIPAVLDRLAPLLDTTALTVTGQPLLAGTRPSPVDDVVLSSLDTPFAPTGGIAVLRGNLAPDGALIKTSAATPALLRHRGPALVFDDHHELSHRIDDPDLDVTPDTVLVLRNAGPIGGPGMPEWGALPLPEKLLRRGVTDMVRISDGRMSGTAFGTVAVHVAPEAAAGGPLSKLRTGDPVVLDVDQRLLAVDVPDDEFHGRTPSTMPDSPSRGYLRLVNDHIMQADQGCDFDFMPADGAAQDLAPRSIPAGWHGGW
ncbi:dihydroxy-acid dehydratase [Rhodococcus jostii]|uniref:Dihydroxy-acid dehydratase n=1 Tax=Rhodococcus jostii TaxID=132919 RepID=A0A1H5E973_RHOJO|nr:dihydroxy-acid dehydratase [Rhodococcus jostii]SED87635.1 dihydroxy-acid dehydratase [Rhodococcus jostii]